MDADVTFAAVDWHGRRGRRSSVCREVCNGAATWSKSTSRTHPTTSRGRRRCGCAEVLCSRASEPRRSRGRRSLFLGTLARLMRRPCRRRASRRETIWRAMRDTARRMMGGSPASASNGVGAAGDRAVASPDADAAYDAHRGDGALHRRRLADRRVVGTGSGCSSGVGREQLVRWGSGFGSGRGRGRACEQMRARSRTRGGAR